MSLLVDGVLLFLFFARGLWADDVLLCSEQCDTAPYCQCEV